MVTKVARMLAAVPLCGVVDGGSIASPPLVSRRLASSTGAMGNGEGGLRKGRRGRGDAGKLTGAGVDGVPTVLWRQQSALPWVPQEPYSYRL